MSQIIMAWGKTLIGVAVTGANDAMAASFTDVGKVKDKSVSLSVSEGDTLEMKATGGELVAREQGEPTVSLAYRIIEPTAATYTLFCGATTSSNDVTLKTLVPSSEFSVKVAPQKAGAKGIKAAKTQVSLSPGYSDEDGNYLDVTHTFLKSAVTDEIATLFEVKAASLGSLSLSTSELTIGATDTKGKVVTLNTNSTPTFTIEQTGAWLSAVAASGKITLTAISNTGAARTAAVTVVADGWAVRLSVTQEAGS